MESEISTLSSTLDLPDGLSCVEESGDIALRILAISVCAEAMLPYWESRFSDDDNMAAAVASIREFARTPTATNAEAVSRARPLAKWKGQRDLSPVEGLDFDLFTPPPAAFAGDSILLAVDEIVAYAHCGSEFRCAAVFHAAIECISRLLAERDPNYSDETVYESMAREQLRASMRDVLRRTVA